MDKNKTWIRLGVEWEFYLPSKVDREKFIENTGVETEYYSTMLEENRFLSDKLYTKKEIYKFLQHVEKVMKKLVEVKYLRTNCWANYSNSFAFNGVHLHISSNKRLLKPTLFNNFINYKMEHPSIRFLTSHHIWGGIRNYTSSSKKSTKYAPIHPYLITSR